MLKQNNIHIRARGEMTMHLHKKNKNITHPHKKNQNKIFVSIKDFEDSTQMYSLISFCISTRLNSRKKYFLIL